MVGAYELLDPIFHPASIAFVGVSTSNPGKWTNTFWHSAIEFQFHGQIYPVNPRGGELNGHRVYRSIDEIPGKVDFAIGTVSAKAAPAVMRSCARKGIKAIQFCTAGFDETGQEQVAGLQEELVSLAKETGVRIIGPNCMGIYCPESRISFNTGFVRDSGNVGLISQSGGNCIFVISEASWRGVRFSKAISFGNACDLNECDFLEYMIEDPQTEIIALYLEGVSDGRRLINLLGRASGVKPVVFIKGGYGTAGARATASHTASLAGDYRIWEAICRQFNIIMVDNVEEMVDVLVTLKFMPEPPGRNVLLIGIGGGTSVLLTDEFERQGFIMPGIPRNLLAKLASFSQIAGNMLDNPVDYSQDMMGSDRLPNLTKAIEILTDWEEVDLCIGFFRPSQMPPQSWGQILKWGKALANAYKSSKTPVAFICDNGILPERQDVIFNLWQEMVNANIPLFYSHSGAAEALRLVIEYNERSERRRLKSNV